LIPYPYATDDHQTSNANVFAEAGAAEVQPERRLTPEALSALITTLLSDDPRREKMSGAARTILPRDAAGNVADEIERAAAPQNP
jgi:UDP-N-acetylglucosamine--N-acetylmuramyl-(pentapeptide) pyrophosphoryl-undecaprenol N-acetylglucosamine transferase